MQARPSHSEEELRAAYEERTQPDHDGRSRAAGGRVTAEPRRTAARACGARRAAARGRTRPRAGARRDRRRARAAGDPRAPQRRRSFARCATRSPSCRWPMRARRARPRRAPSRPPARAERGERRGTRRAGGGGRAGRRGRAGQREDGSQEPDTGRGPGPAQSSGRLWVPGQLRRRRPAARLPGGHARAGPIDCAPRLHRVSALSRDPGRKRAREHPRAARQTDRGGFPLSSFLTNHGVVVALVCAACAVIYGSLTTRLSAGAFARQRAHAEHLAGRSAGRARLPEPPVHDDRGRRGRAVRRADLHPELRGCRAALRSAGSCRARPATSA